MQQDVLCESTGAEKTAAKFSCFLLEQMWLGVPTGSFFSFCSARKSLESLGLKIWLNQIDHFSENVTMMRQQKTLVELLSGKNPF